VPARWSGFVISGRVAAGAEPPTGLLAFTRSERCAQQLFCGLSFAWSWHVFCVARSLTQPAFARASTSTWLTPPLNQLSDLRVYTLPFLAFFFALAALPSSSGAGGMFRSRAKTASSFLLRSRRLIHRSGATSISAPPSLGQMCIKKWYRWPGHGGKAVLEVALGRSPEAVDPYSLGRGAWCVRSTSDLDG
jgi:hypothetical protein